VPPKLLARYRARANSKRWVWLAAAGAVVVVAGAAGAFFALR
jgi:hypothetical protein